MASLYFKVNADWEKVVKLREEIDKLETKLKTFGKSMPEHEIKVTESQLGSARQEFTRLTTEAAKAGAEMENGFKKKIFDASQVVNGLTSEIIKQKNVVKEVEADVKRLGEAYRQALKSNPFGASSKLSEYQAAKKALDEEKATLFGLTQQQAEARLSVKKLRDEYALFKDDSKDSSDAIGELAGKMKNWAVTIAGGIGVKELVSNMIKVRGEFQAADTAIQTLLGSKEKADALMTQVRDYAKISPLEFSDVTKATQMMLGFNVEAEKVPKFIAAIGDVSMGESQKFNSLTLAFSQMSAAGKLMGQDLNQFINAGFNPLQQIAEKTGKSISTLKDEMSKGAISAEMVQQAFIDATSSGGKFFNMSENASKTMEGQFSKLSDAIDAMFNEVGEKSEGIIMAGVKAATKLVESYETVGKILAGLITTYGAYKAAVMLATIAENGHSAATMVMRGRILLAQKAQALLNATMLKNPYVLLTTLAVGAASAIWAFTNRTSAAEKAMKSYNEEKQKAVEKENEHKEAMGKLLSTAEDEAASTKLRTDALRSLEKYYPQIFAKYSTELDMLKDIKKIKEEIAEEEAKNSVTNLDNELYNVNKEINALQAKDKANAKEDTTYAYGEEVKINRRGISDDEIARLEALKKKRDELQRQQKSKRVEDYFKDLTGISNEELQKQIDKRKTLLADLEHTGKRFGAVIGETNTDLNGAFKKNDVQAQLQALERELNKRKEKKSSSSDWTKEAKKKYEADLKAYNDFISSKTNKLSQAEFEKERDRLKSALDTSKKAYDKSKKEQDGSKGTTQKEQDEYKRLQANNAKERIRNAQDLQTQVDEARIAAMEEGSKKTLAEMELNFEKEMQAIDRQKEDYLQKKKDLASAEFEKNPANKDKRFDDSSVTLNDEEEQQFDALYNAQIAAYEKSDKELKEKRKQSWQEYFIEFGTYQEKRKAITEKYEDEIKKIESGSAEYYTLIEQKKKALEDLDSQFGKSVNTMADLFEDASNKTATEIDKLIKKYETLVKYMSGTSNADGSPVTKEQLANLGITNEDISKVEKGEVSIKDLNDALKNLKKELAGKSPWLKFTSDLKSGISEIKKANGDVSKIGKGLTNIGNAVSDFTPALKQFGSDIANIFGVDDEKITQALDAVDGLGQTAAGVGQIMSGDVIDVIGGVMTAVNGVSKIVSAFEGLFGADYKALNELKERYEQLSEIWDELIDKKQEYIDISYGTEAIQAADEALDLLAKKAEYARNLAKEAAGAGASVGSHSIAYRQNRDLDSWKRELDSYTGTSWLSLTDSLLYATPEQLSKIKDTMYEMWMGLDDTFRQALEDIIACDEKAGELSDKLKEAMTGVSFDSFYDSFVSMLKDLDSQNKDFADSFEEYLQNAIYSSLLANKYKERIQNLYTKWSDYSNDTDNGIGNSGLTRKEIDEIRNEYNKIVNDMLAEREEINKTFGFSSSTDSQSASTKGFESMSQDTANELNGRFTAVQESNENIRVSIVELKGTIQELLANNGEQINISNEILTILAQSYLEIQQIRENTGEIVNPIKNISKRIDSISRKIENL